MANILICDDDADIVSALKIYLSNEDYKIYTAFTGRQALDCVKKYDIDLVLMDVMMPEMDGIAATAKLREEYNIPVILLTAKSESSDKVLGLNVGADDYVTKPFNILELKARIRALLRRASMPAAGPSASVLEKGGLEIDTEKRTARKNGAHVELTAREFDLIELFIRNPGKVYSRDNLLDLVWGYDYQGDARTVDVHIRRLREKLEDRPASPKLIITKWGVGYYFAE